MDKLKINLIPPEIKAKSKKAAKQALINRLSIVFLGLLILLTSGVLSIIIYQNVTITVLNSQIEEEKTKVASLKDKELVAFFLKNRLDSIKKYTATQFTQSKVFELITTLFPEGISITSLKIDNTNKVTVVGDTNSTTALENFFNNLVDPNLNEGKIASVSVESLNKGQNGLIRFSLIINLKK